MARIPSDQLTILIDSQAARVIANEAQQTHERQSVAYCINTAVNTGLHETLWQHPLSETMKAELISLGYQIRSDAKSADPNTAWIIGGF